jgi:ATP-binding cassette subfamily B protein
MTHTPATLSRLLNYAKNYRPQVLKATFCSVINKLFDIAPEILIGIAIDVVANREQSFIARFGISEPMSQIGVLGAITLIVWMGESLFEYFYLLLWRGLAQNIQNDLRIDTYDNLQQLDMSYFENQSTGGLVAIVNDDVNQLERFLNVGANSLIQIATTVIAIGGVFFYISPILAMFSFLPIPVVIGGAFYFQKRAQPLYAQVRTKAGYLSSRLTNNISGIATIKSFTAESRELTAFAGESADYCRANERAIALGSRFIPLIRMAILAGFLATFLMGGSMVLDGKLNVGFYGVLVFLTQRLLWPLTGLAETVDLYERAMASTRRILDLLQATPTVISGTEILAKEEIRGRVDFKEVSFAYPERDQVLSRINLSIKAGETIGIVGSTGSGKSTIVKLLLRFYDTSAGSIKIDGIDIRSFNLDSLRSAIGFVSQDVFLFHGTVAENIAYGNPLATRAEIAEVAKIAEADEFITSLPLGYDTVIGERGQKLSGGQRQRLSIARAILKNPPIMILDEATSAVDNETEAAIQRSLRKISVGRTTIIIAHRLSTITHADQIYVVDQGKIVENGSSAELIKVNGFFSNLWKVQVGFPAAGH